MSDTTSFSYSPSQGGPAAEYGLNSNFCSEFTMKVASPEEKFNVIKIMVSKKRQTMNLRLMPNAKLFILQDNAYGGKTIGWAGMDYENNANFPEMFSLFIMPEYRGYRLGSVLTQARCFILDQLGLSKAYIRMEASHNQSLIDYNIRTGIYRILDTAELSFSWISQCSYCELYHGLCKSQVYLEIDIKRLLDKCNKELGTLLNRDFPNSIENNSHKFAIKWRETE